MTDPLEAAEVRPNGPDRDTPPAAPPLPPSRILAVVRTALALAAMGAAGSFVFMRTPAGLILGPVAGIAAALALPDPADAAVAAALGSALGFAFARLVGVPGSEPLPALLPGVLAAALVAALAATFAAYAAGRSPHLRGVLTAGAVGLLVAGLWLGDVRLATLPAPDGTTFAGMMSASPPMTPETLDEALYLKYVERLRAGEPYYPMVGRVLTEANALREVPFDLTTPLSFRLPTLYRALALLPPQGIWLVLASLGCATAAVVAAYALSSRLAPAPFAFVGAAAAASFYGGQSINATLLDTEMWAGALGLVAVALLVRAYDAARPRAALAWAAAGAALAAALVRELAVAFLLVGLVAALADRRRSIRTVLPWALGLAGAAAAYVAHFAAARAVIATLDATPLSPEWFHPDGRGLAAVVSRVAALSHVAVPFAWVLFVAGVAGVLLGAKGTPRLALGATVVGGILVVSLMHPTGHTVGGGVPGYWGDVVAGAVLAAVPLASARLRGRPRAEDQTASAASSAGASGASA